MSKRWKISIGIIAGLVVVLAIVLNSPVGLFILKGGLSEMKEQPFESQQWKDVRDGDVIAKRIRLLMLEDLMENKLKTGMDSIAVKTMLGEPERQFGFSYGLGAVTEGIDPVFLIVDFDSVGHVSKLNVESEGNLKGESGSVIIKMKE